MPALIGGALAAGGSVIGGLFGKAGANKAADAQKQAAALQLQMYHENVNRLQPWVTAGAGALPTVSALTTPGSNMTSVLRQMPGYQFALDQGLKSTQSAAAARGLGVSGAALKGAGTFATGIADKTYSEMFSNALDVAKLGANAAAGVGQAGTSAAATAGGELGTGGLYQGQGIQGIGNAAVGGLQNYLNYSLMQKMFPQGTTNYPTSGQQYGPPAPAPL
jgi:type II secretory pathway pseudopilin PulG